MTNNINNNFISPSNNVNLSTNLINIGFGQKILANAGIVNTVVVGGWNRLLAGSSTEIQLGTKMNINWTDSVNVTFGNSWNYFDNNQTTRLIDLKYAVNELSISAGINQNRLPAITAYNKQQTLVVLSIVTMFAFTFGMAILFAAYPPFERNTNKSNQFSTSGIYILSGEILSIVFLFLVQFLYAKQKSENNPIDMLSTKLSLSAKGLSAIVYDNNPGATKPNLVKANDTDKNIEYDYYSPGTAGFSMLGMLPGMYSINQDDTDKQHKKLNVFNWRNPESGVYQHDKNPAITLYSRASRTKKLQKPSTYSTLNSAAIDLLPDSIMITSENEIHNVGENNHVPLTATPEEISRASIILDPANSEQLAISCLSHNNNYGSLIALDKNQTLISQQMQTIDDQSFIKLEVANTVNFTTVNYVNDDNDDDDDYNDDNEDSTSILATQYTSGVKLSNNQAQLYANKIENLANGRATTNNTSISISEQGSSNENASGIILFTCENTDVARFTDNHAVIGDCLFTAEGSNIGKYLTTRPVSPYLNNPSYNLDSASSSSSGDQMESEFSLIPNSSKLDIRENFPLRNSHYQTSTNSMPQTRQESIHQRLAQRAEQIKQHVMAIQGIVADPNNLTNSQ